MKLISKKTLLLFFLPGAIFMGAFLIYPIFKMVFDSFFKVGITGARTFIGFDNYIKAFTAGGFLKQLKNTLIYILIASAQLSRAVKADEISVVEPTQPLRLALQSKDN